MLPDDSYDATGTYWADMKIFKRAKFVNSVDSAEAKTELKSIGRMMKKDPLSPVSYYMRNMVLPGAGLLLEGCIYLCLFSIGNVKPLYSAAFPECWDSKKPQSQLVCDKQWLKSVEYLEILGIILGRILVGFVGDWLGRRWGLIQDALIMLLGLVMLVASWGTTLNGWVICYADSLFVYGIGVGSEYPMTATSGMENATGSGKTSTRADRLHCGRKVTSAFLMQGWGQLCNHAIILLLVFHHGSGNPPYSKLAVQWTYRISFAIPALGTLWLVYYRTWKMHRASAQLLAAKKKAHITGYDVASLKLCVSHFGFRLLATAGAWFNNDVFFYGNKLFQSLCIETISPNSKSVMTNWLWSLCNVGVSLLGHCLASFLIDHKLYGRKWMMIIGFMVDFVLFIIPAFNFEYYTHAGVRGFQAMYFLSSFFNQFGPNAVTFIVAAEVYPTSIRATAHGFSAAAGKLGALLAGILYNYLTTQQIFLFVPWFGLLGAVLTLLFLPDTTGLDLKEQERRWKWIREGRGEAYRGVAVHPKHLSWWERMRGVGGRYDAGVGWEMKVSELRGEGEAVFEDDTTLASYFMRTGSPMNSVMRLTETEVVETPPNGVAVTGSTSEARSSETSEKTAL